MSGVNQKKSVRWIIDALMTVLLLLLMAYQVTGDVLHEWIGVGMTALVIVHQILNRKWYGALFRGKYHLYRILTTVLNVLLLAGFFLTAFCGMSMSGHAVPFLYGMAPVSFARRMHLSMSHWSFVLMGLHLGLHLPVMTAGFGWKPPVRNILTVIFTIAGGIGLYLFLNSRIPDYLFFRVPFAFLDYDKAGWLVVTENLLTLLFWALIGTQAAHLCRATGSKESVKKNLLFPAVSVAAALLLGIALRLIFPS